MTLYAYNNISSTLGLIPLLIILYIAYKIWNLFNKQEKKKEKIQAIIKELEIFNFALEYFFKRLPFEAPTLSRDAMNYALNNYLFGAEVLVHFKNALQNNPNIDSFTFNFNEMNKNKT